MGPDPSHNPAIKSVEELANVGAFVILAPSPQQRVKFRNQLLGLQRYPPLGSLPYVCATSSSLICLKKLSSPLSSMVSNVTPSIPGAPLLLFAIR